MIHHTVAWINFVLGAIILVLLVISVTRLYRIKHMFYISISFMIVAVLFLVHATVEVLHLSHYYYAITALIATLLLGYAVYTLRKNSSIDFKGGSA